RRELTDEEREIEEEKKARALIDKQVEALDPKTVEKVKKKIREKFDLEIEADPEDLEDYFSDLDDVRDDLILHSLTHTKDKVLSTLEHQIIMQIFEEKLVSIGSSLEAFNEWLEKEDLEDEYEDEHEDELREEEPSENVSGHYKR
ncbi:MAG: hypothetical protein K2L98_01200, partial [Bacilli bacterium]|nr:hypothetical protein [Bacilli bacterium]